MSSEVCLVLTNSEDEQLGHVPFVAQHMDPEKLVIVDPIPDVLDGKVGFDIGDKGITCTYGDLPLNPVMSVWDRRPTVISKEMLEDVHPAYRQYASSAIRNHASQFYTAFNDALWVSDHFAVMRAEHKILQLAEAGKLGFAVPETLFTSDHKAAQSFVASRPATIIKGLSNVGPYTDETLMLFYSTRVTPDTEIDYSNLNFAPAIFQDAIDPEYDLRITVVDEAVFPASVVADIEKDITLGIRDWRIGNSVGNLAIEAREIPEDISDKCIQLVKNLGLKFGAIDMIVDKKGRYWFTEINPNGQWAFVELETGQQIGKAMAELLLRNAVD